jgi:uncharacterized protein YgiM (DUF1202 family)
MRTYNIIAFIFLLFVQNVFVDANENNCIEIKKGSAYIFADNVLFRDAPTQQGKILSKFSIATKVEIIEKASALTNVNGADNYWYKIKK